MARYARLLFPVAASVLAFAILHSGAASQQDATLEQSPQVAAAPNGPDVTTYHYNNTRQGLNAQETILTHANVNRSTFGKVGFIHTDGKVDAQPLYVGAVHFPKVTANVLY